ncbi:hypothetical protein EG68_05167 [Paragonimus skrjabini miyazakii]|uniref:Uncharacterized protein n=1 Tax=Paragonimus skrjabini miyazakii TaxID=59628 RepID=A0A8S9YQJ8_9TREM|nr:hypothetical protein EG68_05167 [Paragonimus skrjabini miyazakii]
MNLVNVNRLKPSCQVKKQTILQNANHFVTDSYSVFQILTKRGHFLDELFDHFSRVNQRSSNLHFFRTKARVENPPSQSCFPICCIFN